MTGKQLVQGCYAVAWVGVEPTTFELQGRTLSTEPRRPGKLRMINKRLNEPNGQTTDALFVYLADHQRPVNFVTTNFDQKY